MWRAFDSVEPIGDWRMDMGFGIVASTIANANREKNAPAFKPVDFMPFVERPKELTLVQKVRQGLMSLGNRGKK